jgi:hypothetical protein
MPLLEHQIVIGRGLQTPDSNALTAETVQELKIQRLELVRLLEIVDSPGFRFTRRVQRSWCVGRTAMAAQLTLSLLPVEQRRQLVEAWVDLGGGRALDPASEAAEFLEFVADSLTDPSHALSVCRMEQAAYHASEAALRFRPPDLSLLDHPKAVLHAGKAAAMVRFFAEPQRLFDAIAANEPLPPLSDRPFPVLFAPGLPRLYRSASSHEAAIWEKLAGGIAARALLRDLHSQEVLKELFSIGAGALAAETDPPEPDRSGISKP